MNVHGALLALARTDHVEISVTIQVRKHGVLRAGNTSDGDAWPSGLGLGRPGILVNDYCAALLPAGGDVEQPVAVEVAQTDPVRPQLAGGLVSRVDRMTLPRALFHIAAVGLGSAKAPNEFQDVSCAGVVLPHEVGPDAVVRSILEFVDGDIGVSGFFQRNEHRLVLLATIGSVVLGVKEKQRRGVPAGVMQWGGESVSGSLLAPHPLAPRRANPAHIHQPADGNGTTNSPTCEAAFFQERIVQCKQCSQVSARRAAGHK